MWKVYLLMFFVVGIISYLWVRGIDYMKDNHPDYEGEDFLNLGDEKKEKLNSQWDDNKIHTEGGF